MSNKRQRDLREHERRLKRKRERVEHVHTHYWRRWRYGRECAGGREQCFEME